MQSMTSLRLLRSNTHVTAAPQAAGRQLRCPVVCMAHPRRVAKVASQIQREISEMFIYDKVVQEAICPERRSGMDTALSAVASITDVYVSGDLQVVKVYVSVYSDDAGKERAVNNLKRIAPYVRSRIGQAVRLRLTPEIRFIQDNSLDELERIQDAIGQEDFDRYVAEAEAEAGGSSSSSSSSAAAGASADGEGAEGEDDEDEDDDSGFFDMQDGGGEEEGGGEASSSGRGADGGEQQAQRGVAWSRQDPAKFFEVDEDELEEAELSGSLWYTRAGPFDDLFVGAGDAPLAAERPARAKGGRGRGGGRGGRQQKRIQQQQPKQQQ